MNIILENQANMKQGATACLHLGSSSDPAVCFSYANPNNYCYRPYPPEPVRISYQERVCLSTGYFDCPLYQPDWNGSLPREISANPHSRHSLLYWAAMALAVGAIALVLWYASTLIFTRSFSPDVEAQPTPLLSTPAQENLSATGGDLPASDSGLPTPLPLIAPLATSTSSPTLSAPTQPPTDIPPTQPVTDTPPPSLTAPPPSPTSPPAQESATCQPPANWMRYTVRPGDTLSLLSQLSGASVAEIRTANCLSKSNLIFVGQQIYLPYFYSSSGGSSAPPAPPDRGDTSPLPPPDR